MRTIGIVKWFGGFNNRTQRENNYGLIIKENGEELFVHLNDIKSNPAKIYKGKIVTYDIAINARKNLEKAIDVRVLDDETIGLIKSLSEKKEPKYWMQALPIYLDKLTLPDALTILKERLLSIEDNGQKLTFIKNLNPLFFKVNNELRTILDSESRIEICLRILNLKNASEEERLELIDEVLENIRKITSFKQKYYQRIPREYLKLHKNFRTKLDNNNYVNIIIEMLDENLIESKSIDNLVEEFESFTNTNFYVESDAWDRLPEKVFENRPDLIKKLSLKRQFELVKKDLVIETENMQYDKLLECIRLIQSLRDDSLYDQIPEKYYEIYKNIRIELPMYKHMEILNKIYLNPSHDDNAEKKQEFINHIIKEYARTNFALEDEKWFDLIPKEILLDKSLWFLLKQKTKLILLLETKVYDQNNIKEIEELIVAADEIEQVEMLNLLNDDVFMLSKKTLPLLDPIRQAQIIGDGISPVSKYWKDLNGKTKMYLIYRSIQEKKSIEYIWNNYDETNIMVKLATLLLQAKHNPLHKNIAFEQAHNLLQEYVIEKAWSSNEKLDFYPLLPDCLSHLVDYCETKPWPTEEDRIAGSNRTSRFFCPRGKCKCIPSSEISNINWEYLNLFGARLYPDMNLIWKNWSLIELLEYAEITPSLPELSNSIEYVPKMCGWLNRLNEIRARLKCSYCNETMIPNLKYSKHLAVYNQTVVSCPNRADHHDYKIYLSHCWACREIIDSRECKKQVENFYLCLHCASGPKKSQSYRQGSICPKCGGSNILSIDQRLRKCNEIDCLHTFKIPSKKFLTGS